MKKAIAMLLAAGMMFSMTACGEKENSEKDKMEESKNEEVSDGKKHYKLAYAFSNIDENNQRSLNAIQEKIEQINEEREDIEVEFIYTDSQSQVDKQIADVESLIQQEPDLVLISAVDVVGSVPCAEAVKNAGIYCMDDRGMDSEAIDTMFQGMDENSIKEMKKEFVIDYLEENPDATLNFGLIYGLASQSEQLKRNEDIVELAEEMPDRVKILDSQYADWSTDKATSIMEDWLQRYPEMNAVSAASDDMALGVCNALAANGKEGFFTMAVDGTKIGCELVRDGKLTVTIKADIPMIYHDWVDISLQAIDGTFSEEYYTPGTEALVAVTKDNVEENLAENQ